MKRELVHECWQRFIAASPSQKHREYVRACLMLIELVDREELSIEDACYSICGYSSQLPRPLSSAEEQILDIAADLELPADYRTRPIADWQTLVTLSRKLAPDNKDHDR